MGFCVQWCTAGVLLLLVALIKAELVDITPYHSTIIDRHNEIRREVGASDMQALDWDEGLAAEAESWVKYCRYERAPSYMSTCGQNLYYTQSYVRSWAHINRAIKRAMKVWNNEKLYFKYGMDCGSSCSYSQVVWAEANRIGCAMNRCPVMKAGGYLYRKTLFACFYSPKGEMTNDFPYTPGVPCSLCPLGMGCEGGLCVPGVAVAPAPPPPPPQNLIGPEVAPPTRGGAVDTWGRGVDTRGRAVDNIPERIPQTKPDPPILSTVCIPSMSATEVHFLLMVTNRLRARDSCPDVAWSEELEQWAQYVIRCDREYPGPRTAYSSFGKIGATTPLYQLLYEWGDEGLDTNIQLVSGGCRTPGDAAKCNHNTNMMATTNTRMGCAACLCGGMRQLTCIYDSK